MRSLPLALALSAVVIACSGRTDPPDAASPQMGCPVDGVYDGICTVTTGPDAGCGAAEYLLECNYHLRPDAAVVSVTSACRSIGSPPPGVDLYCCACGT